MACIDCFVEPECCGNFNKNGACCNEPNPHYICSQLCQIAPDNNDNFE